MLRRIFTNLQQRLGSTVGALLAPAVDPRLVSGDQIQEFSVLLREVRQASARVDALREQLKERAKVVGEQLPQLDDEARQALVNGHDDLARAILQRRQIAAREGNRLEAQVNGLEVEDQRLALLAQRLLAQIESLSTLKSLAAAQYSAAETRGRISEALASVARNLGDLRVDTSPAEQRPADEHILEQTVDEHMAMLKSKLAKSESAGEE